jgi:hypothetical protein
MALFSLSTDVEALRWREATDTFAGAAEQMGAPGLMTRIAKLTPHAVADGRVERTVLVQRLLGALLFTNLGAPNVRRTEQKCAERSLDQRTSR